MTDKFVHDPHWFENRDSPERNTDYNFPPDWGLYSPEQKTHWFLEQRVKDQMERQYNAGMWNQFSTAHTDGMSIPEALNDVEKSNYKL